MPLKAGGWNLRKSGPISREMKSALSTGMLRHVPENPGLRFSGEERELTMFLMVDLSPSGQFSSGSKSKNEMAAELCAMLAFTAISNNDRVGLSIFTDCVEKVIYPGKGNRHVLHLIREVLTHRPTGSGTSIKAALDYTASILKKRAIIILVSDFLDSGYEDALSYMGEKHDLVCIQLQDRREIEPPGRGLFLLRDAESGKKRYVDFNDRMTRRNWINQMKDRQMELEKTMRRKQADLITLKPDDDWVKSLTRFFIDRGNRNLKKIGILCLDLFCSCSAAENKKNGPPDAAIQNTIENEYGTIILSYASDTYNFVDEIEITLSLNLLNGTILTESLPEADTRWGDFLVRKKMVHSHESCRWILLPEKTGQSELTPLSFLITTGDNQAVSLDFPPIQLNILSVLQDDSGEPVDLIAPDEADSQRKPFLIFVVILLCIGILVTIVFFYLSENETEEKGSPGAWQPGNP